MDDYIDLVIAKLDEDHIVMRAPWNTVRAGDTVYVTGGLYVVEGLKPGHSGSEGRFVVFRPLPGTGEVVVRHPDVLPGDYSAVFDLSGLKYVWLGGFTFRDLKYAKCPVADLNGWGIRRWPHGMPIL